MFSASTSYINRQPWRPSGTMISPPCRETRSKTLHKGLTFFIISILVLLSGTVMTVSGFTQLVDSGISMLGMLLMAISVLLFLGGLRQYLMARNMKPTEHTLEVNQGTMAAALVIESDETNRTLTVVMDTVGMDMAYASDRRSTDDSLPPDYIEATTGSDMYTDSNCCVVIDSSDDPPPPYGPPTYEQAISQDDSYTPYFPCDVNFRHQSVTDLLYDRNSQLQSVMTNQQIDASTNQQSGVSTNQQSGVLTNHLPGGLTNQVTDVESHSPVGYQDLPTVTI